MSLKNLYKEIELLESYTPSKKVNALFSELIDKAIDPVGSEVLSVKKRINLQRICSQAEVELERYWANKILSGTPVEEFPYYRNYVELTGLEWGALISCDQHQHKKILFVGSGPLPMTAIILARDYGVSSTLIDNDTLAVNLSRAVISYLGLQNMIKVIKHDAESFKHYGDYSVVMVAALVGANDREKIRIFKHIKNHTKKYCHIIARSSWGKRTLLYPPLPQKIYSLFQPILEITPHNGIINSVVILKVR
ncbi:MAG: nicotianamine synthase family protein [Candidatus Colwellbacteria bacterium]